MQVFKVYFKIIKANMGQMSIYLIFFLAMSITISLLSTPKSGESFSQLKQM